MTETRIAKFDRILDLERAVAIMNTIKAFESAGVSNHVKAQHSASLEADKARLSESVDALTLDEMREFGEYRAAALAQ